MADAFSTPPTGDPSPLTELVGEGKKFATVDDLAKGKQESDAFIVKLQEENKQALDALEEAQGKSKDSATVSELLQAVKDSQNKAPDDKTPQLSEADLVNLVKTTLQGENASATAEANRKEANALVLQKVGGDEVAATAYVAERAKALGITPERLGELSEESVSAFATLVGLTPTQTPTKGISDLPSAITPASVPLVIKEIDGHRTKAHYDVLKKDMGTMKFLQDKSIQIAMMKDAQALGMERFNS